MQQAEVHRHTEPRVRHRVVAEHHGVFVGPEVAQPGLDEVVEGRERLGACRREPARTVAAEEAHPLCLEAVELGAHLGVDVVFDRLPGRRQPESRSALRRRLAVVGVEAELAALRPCGRHEQACALAHVPVEAVHDELRGLPPLGPGGEVSLARHEAPRRQDARAELAHQAPRGPRRRVDRLEVTAREPRIRQRRTIAARLDERAPLAQLARPMPQGRQVEVRLLPVRGSTPEHRRVLDEHDRAAVVERRAELFGSEPAGRDGRHAPTLRCVLARRLTA